MPDVSLAVLQKYCNTIEIELNSDPMAPSFVQYTFAHAQQYILRTLSSEDDHDVSLARRCYLAYNCLPLEHLYVLGCCVLPEVDAYYLHVRFLYALLELMSAHPDPRDADAYHEKLAHWCFALRLTIHGDLTTLFSLYYQLLPLTAHTPMYLDSRYCLEASSITIGPILYTLKVCAALLATARIKIKVV